MLRWKRKNILFLCIRSPGVSQWIWAVLLPKSVTNNTTWQLQVFLLWQKSSKFGLTDRRGSGNWCVGGSFMIPNKCSALHFLLSMKNYVPEGLRSRYQDPSFCVMGSFELSPSDLQFCEAIEKNVPSRRIICLSFSLFLPELLFSCCSTESYIWLCMSIFSFLYLLMYLPSTPPAQGIL